MNDKIATLICSTNLLQKRERVNTKKKKKKN